MITWLPVTSSIDVTQSEATPAAIVEELRRSPGSDVLRELRHIGVGAPKFGVWKDDEIIKAANDLFTGQYTLEGQSVPVTVPFDGSSEKFGVPGWDLDLCSFIVPALLARAFEVSKNTRYLDGAVDYIVAWAAFESSLFVPRGLVFNDHATAARAIVVSEVWRLYRGGPSYEDATANELLHYVRRIRQLLSKPELFEYRTNHGFMQSLSLLHLSLAFPVLEYTDGYASLAVDRLFSQLPYHLSTEGVILEHSAGYHLNGLHRLAAVWRYLGLLNQPVPDELVNRYEKSLEVAIQLLRPDRTLPPIGDTRTRQYGQYPVASFADEPRIARHIDNVDLEGTRPEPSFVAPAAGLSVFWSGLDTWPTAEGLSQTVVHWGNFDTQSHKHADEMGISLWAGGKQWIRGIGSWPYDKSRRRATGWRSSNAPHWLNEPRLGERDTVLEGRGSGDTSEFLELARRNIDGSEFRRQLILLDGNHWIVLDSYHSDTPREAEVLWRFSPELILESAAGSSVYFVESADDSSLGIHLVANKDWTIESDASGSAEWNTGVESNREIVPSPAIRGTSIGKDLVIAAVFSIGNSQTDKGSSLQWRSNDKWSLSLEQNRGTALRLERRGGNLTVTSAERITRVLRILPVGRESNSLAQEEESFLQMQKKYGRPIQFRLERRVKVSAAVVLVTLLQYLVFVFIRQRFPRMLGAALTLSAACWLGLCLFLHLSFLA
jgi:hypothetical protein